MNILIEYAWKMLGWFVAILMFMLAVAILLMTILLTIYISWDTYEDIRRKYAERKSN